MTSNVTEFYKQSRQVLPEKPTGLVSKAREYCLQLPRVSQAWLASRTSVEQEPYKCCSRTGTFPLHQQFIGKIIVTEAVRFISIHLSLSCMKASLPQYTLC